ncbi:MAG: GNAT family N-acetyltransferase [Nitrospiraceae bacterium]|nr:GNAT family N-acetyltransferase [Nitrospiraceae bacterium]
MIEIDPLTDPRWETFLAAHPDRRVYHHPAYLECVRREYGQPAVNLACEDAGGQLRGILPLLYTKPFPFRLGGGPARRLSSLPRTPVGGPLVLDHAAYDTLMGAAIARVQGDPDTLLEVRMACEAVDAPRHGGQAIAQFPSYVLTLPAKGQTLRFGSPRNHSAIHRAVNKSIKSGIQIHEAQTERELRAWYWLYLETHRWHARQRAIPARSYEFFKACLDTMQPKGLARLLLAVRPGTGRGEIVAGSFMFMYGKSTIYGYNGRRQDALDLRPNDAIHWRAIHDAHESGYSEYDFGDVGPENEGLARFKKKWGAEPHPQWRYYYPAPAATPSKGTGGPTLSRRVRNALCSRAPLAIWALHSSLLRRYM